MCYWTTFLSGAVSFPCNTENLRLYQENILHGQDKVSLVLFIACRNLIRGRYAGFKNALPATLYFFFFCAGEIAFIVFLCHKYSGYWTFWFLKV